MESAVFSEAIAMVVRLICQNKNAEATIKIHSVIVDRLLHETRETIGTDGEVDPDDAFQNLVEETTMEMVFAMADETLYSVSQVADTVDRFISTHLMPLKSSIISDVESNLDLPVEAQSDPRRRWCDNDMN